MSDGYSNHRDIWTGTYPEMSAKFPHSASTDGPAPDCTFCGHNFSDHEYAYPHGCNAADCGCQRFKFLKS